MCCLILETSSNFYFFFQAEDGIRYTSVTGVQTCALPICFAAALHAVVREDRAAGKTRDRGRGKRPRPLHAGELQDRSEERRVGKSVDIGGRRINKKKKNRK